MHEGGALLIGASDGLAGECDHLQAQVVAAIESEYTLQSTGHGSSCMYCQFIDLIRIITLEPRRRGLGPFSMNTHGVYL